jgi:hypothetical protein
MSKFIKFWKPSIFPLFLPPIGLASAHWPALFLVSLKILEFTQFFYMDQCSYQRAIKYPKMGCTAWTRGQLQGFEYFKNLNFRIFTTHRIFGIDLISWSGPDQARCLYKICKNQLNCLNSKAVTEKWKYKKFKFSNFYNPSNIWNWLISHFQNFVQSIHNLYFRFLYIPN